jgi:hypothetical protein
VCVWGGGGALRLKLHVLYVEVSTDHYPSADNDFLGDSLVPGAGMDVITNKKFFSHEGSNLCRLVNKQSLYWLTDPGENILGFPFQAGSHPCLAPIEITMSVCPSVHMKQLKNG